MIRYTLLIQRINILIGAFFFISGTLFSQITVNSINELRGVNPGTNQTIQVRGYYEPADWGDARVYDWNPADNRNPNNGTIISSVSMPNQGRWVMRVVEDYYSPLWFGAKRNDQSFENNDIIFQKTIDTAIHDNVNRVFVHMPGVYWFKRRESSSSIRISELHNGLEFFGILNIHYLDKYQGTGSTEWIYDGENEKFPIVDAEKSVIFKKIPRLGQELFDKSRDLRLIGIFHDGGKNIENIYFHNFATDGSSEQNEGLSDIFVFAFHNVNSIRFENMASFNSGGIGISIYSSNVTIKNYLAYLCFYQGVSQSSYGSFVPEGNYYENIRVWGNGFWGGGFMDGFGGSGFNMSQGAATVRNVHMHHNSLGGKTSIGSKGPLNMVGVRTEWNKIHGWTDQGDSPDLEYWIDDYYAYHNGGFGLRLLGQKGKIHFGSVTAINNGHAFHREWGGNIHLSGVGNKETLTVRKLVARDQAENTTGNYSVRIGGDVVIDYLEVLNNQSVNQTSGVIVSGNNQIRSGVISNNRSSGILLDADAELYLFNVRFGDESNRMQSYRDIYDMGNSTLYFSGLDFSHSIANTKMSVNTTYEIPNVTLINHAINTILFSEDEINIEVYASSPTHDISKIEFYSDGMPIGSVTDPPYTLKLQGFEPGTYTITAVATFSDNSQESSNSITLTIHSRSKSQRIDLQSGWNTISSYIIPDIIDIGLILGGIKKNVTMVTNNEGNVYWPSLEIDEIGEWNIHEGYQVYMESPDTLIISGTQQLPEQTTISLSQGWNLASYLIEESYPIEDALQSIQQAIQIVTDNSGRIFWPETGINTIGHMKPGQGYKIFLKSDAELIYPSVSVGIPKLVYGGGSIQKSDVKSLNSRRYIIEYGNTGVTSILLVESSRFIYGDEVGVWNESGVLVGSGVIVNGKAAITIWGRNKLLADKVFGADEQENLRLTLWSVGEQKEYPLKIVSLRTLIGEHRNPDNFLYESGAILIADVEIDNFIPERYTLKQNFPNPFNPSTTISYEIPREVHVKLEVYNLLGQRVQLLIDEVQQSGYHQIVFQADNFASGVYFYRLQAANYTDVKKMMLIR
jgi:hypothetical protein